MTSPSPTKFQPGTQVYALTSFERAGNAREITIVEEEEMALIPKAIFWREAAAVPMSALTAWQALFVHGSLKGQEGRKRTRGQENAHKRVLVVGASGAIGFWAVELAKWACIGHVVGVCGTDNIGFVKAFGADEVIDHRVNGIGAWIKDKGEESKENGQKSKKKGQKSRGKKEGEQKGEEGEQKGEESEQKDEESKFDIVINAVGGEPLKEA